MRTIKFRVWDQKKSEMLQYPYDGSGIFIDPMGKVFWDENPADDRLIVEQFTGLKDKNGREIYEGDILKRPTFDTVSVVQWNTTHACFERTFGQNVGSLLFTDAFEVTGTIHENPELLAKRKNP